MIPLAKPWLTKAEEQAVVSVLRSGWLTSGPYVEKLEALVASRCDRKHAVAVSSGTTALELALRALGVGAGDDVLCPALTWPSPAHAIQRVGARAILVDVDPNEWNATGEAFAAARSERTRAAIVIDQFGNPVRDQAIAEALEGVVIIEDAACALGSFFASGRPCGSLGEVGCFSFHPRKIVTTGEGGVCVTDDDDLADALRIARNHGQRAPGEFVTSAGNHRLSDLLAAVGVAQMERLDEILERRRSHAQIMHQRLSGLYRLQRAPEGSCPNYQTLGVLLGTEHNREALIAAAAHRGVQVGRLSYAVDRVGLIAASSPLPIARSLDERGIALPLYPTMTEEERTKVIVVMEALA